MRLTQQGLDKLRELWSDNSYIPASAGLKLLEEIELAWTDNRILDKDLVGTKGDLQATTIYMNEALGKVEELKNLLAQAIFEIGQHNCCLAHRTLPELLEQMKGAVK